MLEIFIGKLVLYLSEYTLKKNIFITLWLEHFKKKKIACIIIISTKADFKLIMYKIISNNDF